MSKVLHALVVGISVSAIVVGFLWGAMLLISWVFTTLGVLAGIMTGLFLVMFVIMFFAALEVN